MFVSSNLFLDYVIKNTLNFISSSLSFYYYYWIMLFNTPIFMSGDHLNCM